MRIYLLFLLLSATASAQTNVPSCTDRRYIDELFTVDEQFGISYGNAPAVVYPTYISESTTYNKNLTLNLYRPLGDSLTKRPAMVIVFGGAFLIGTNLQPQLVDYCRYFAKRGYVVAAIDYRLGFNTVNGQTAIRAVYRAAQDVKAAIRFLKYNANTYGIDTNYVFAGGNSAGGIASIHAAYVNETERNAHPAMDPTYGGGTLLDNWSDLGCTECSGNAYGLPPHNISGVPDLVIDLWGAIADTSFMQSATDAPLISFHGTADPIVIVDTGAPFNYPAFPPLYGAIPIAARANHIGMMNEMHLFQGAGHEVWVSSSDAAIIHQQSAEFFYRFLQPDTPTISGNANVCGNSIETYSVVQHPESIYCWTVTGGTIIGNNTGNTINVQWLPNVATGSLTVREISRNVVESDAAVLNVGIIQLSTPSNLTTVYTTTNRAEIAWTTQVGLSVVCEYRLLGSPAWITATGTLTTGIVLNNLQPCQTYEVRTRAVCAGIYYSNYSSSYTFTTDCLRAQVRIFLEGFYDINTNLMRTTLRTANLLPTVQPYNQVPWNYTGNESLASLPTNMVDWVLLEARDMNNPATILDRSAGILLSNGNVIDIDGNPGGVKFRQLTQVGNYYVSVKHRNHVGVMTASPTLLPSPMVYDFSTSISQARGNTQQTVLPNSTITGLFAADYNHDGIISRADYLVYRQTVLFSPQYHVIDGNGNSVQDNADFDFYRKNAQVIGIIEVR